MDNDPLERDHPALLCLCQGRCHDPFTLLGCHPLEDGRWVLRAWLPRAAAAAPVLVEDEIALAPLADSGVFSVVVDAATKERLPQHWRVSWRGDDGGDYSAVSPYTFYPQVSDEDLWLFAEGRHWRIYRVLGAQVCRVDGIDGVQFAVWAPAARRVAVVGDFNAWDGLRHPMRCRGGSGVWELFIPQLTAGERYKFEILGPRDNTPFMKADPYARAMELRPRTAALVEHSVYRWADEGWLEQRRRFDWQHAPITIYEVHLGSWQRGDDGGFLNYRELAHRLVEYVTGLGYTHINLLPISEHPLDESWGYQVSAYYAPTSRYGSGDDFRYFVDYCHQHGVGVFLDWVPAHFPKDSFALGRFDGTAVYEHQDPRRGEHRDWGTYIFNFGRNEVRNFLIANALYWLEEFHIDGLRVDAVASMLYLDYSRPPGAWLPNEYGGNENLQAVEFMRILNTEVHARCPGAVMMAEESTSWPQVSRPVWTGGLGFSMKWNLGWMNDVLSYFSHDPIHRAYHHNQLTFSQMYAYHENFILPLSHDEVVHMKGSLVNKMPGDSWQQLANVRLLLGLQMAQPGKKLLFMGGEFAQRREWDCGSELDWFHCDDPAHSGVQLLVGDLNRLYRHEVALYGFDFEPQGFEWIDCHDYRQSVLSFIRQAQGRQLVCVFNFTPMVRYNYRIGLPGGGVYHEIINSDATCYGGSGVGNAGAVYADGTPFMGRPASAEITLPPLGFILLRPASED